MSFGASGNTPDPYFAFSWARMAAWTAGSLDCRGWGKKGEEQKTKKITVSRLAKTRPPFC